MTEECSGVILYSHTPIGNSTVVCIKWYRAGVTPPSSRDGGKGGFETIASIDYNVYDHNLLSTLPGSLGPWTLALTAPS